MFVKCLGGNHASGVLQKIYWQYDKKLNNIYAVHIHTSTLLLEGRTLSIVLYLRNERCVCVQICYAVLKSVSLPSATLKTNKNSLLILYCFAFCFFSTQGCQHPRQISIWSNRGVSSTNKDSILLQHLQGCLANAPPV